MTSDQSQVTLSNLSLLSIGGKSQISNFQENSPQARACAQLFSYTFGNLARAAYWNCLRKQQILTLLQAAQGTPENPDGTTLPTPPPPFLYAYEIPSDSLACRWLVPAPPIPASNSISPAMIPCQSGYYRGNIPFKIAMSTDSLGNSIQILLTNLRQAQLVYTANQQNPTFWDSEFQSAFVASLAALLVPALAMNRELMAIQIKMAEGMINQARVRDAQEGTTSQDNLPDFIRVRASGGGWDCGALNGTYGNNGNEWGDSWTSMPW